MLGRAIQGKMGFFGKGSYYSIMGDGIRLGRLGTEDVRLRSL